MNNKNTNKITTLKTLLMLSIMSVIFVSGGIISAQAGNDLECSVTETGGPFDNVKVEAGDSCTLDGVTVNGNVQADGADTVKIINGSIVTGDIQIKKSTADSRVIITNSTIGGNVQLEENNSNLVLVKNSDIAGDVQLLKNDVSKNIVINNIIGGNLQCQENNPDPIVFGNTVTSSVQCDD